MVIENSAATVIQRASGFCSLAQDIPTCLQYKFCKLHPGNKTWNMSNRQKSLFRGPGVKHYALVHRSVRDPALNEDGATERVLAEMPKKQVSGEPPGNGTNQC